MKKIPVANTLLGKEEIENLKRVIESNWISQGPMVKQFEDVFASYVGAKYAVAVNNGTSALHLVLAALGVGPGDEVIIPSLTFVSTANVVLYQGAVPVLAECDPETFNITPEIIKKLITDKTKAIMPVDMNGMPVDYDGIIGLAEKNGIPVIADSAESFGAVYKNKKVGSIAPTHCFSFFPNKNITTGEGGMITLDNKDLNLKLRELRSQGQRGRYNHVSLGYNYRMTELQAAVGLAQIKRIEGIICGKAEIAQKYNKLFKDFSEVRIPFVPEYVTKHGWYMYAIQVNLKKRDDVVKKLADAGIETRLSFPPVHIQPYYVKKFGYTPESFPTTYKIFRKLIDIPIWIGLEDGQINMISAKIMEILK